MGDIVLEWSGDLPGMRWVLENNERIQAAADAFQLLFMFRPNDSFDLELGTGTEGVELRGGYNGIVRRGVFRLAIVVSLPLFVATVALWVESYDKAMAVSGFDRTSRTGVVVTRGELLVYRQLYLDQQGPPQWVRWERFVGRAVEMDVYLMPGTTPHLGFFYGERGTRVYPTRQFLVPMWAVAIVFGAAPVTWVMLAVRRKQKPGVCFKCGYDLTGNESGVCPECGREIVM